MTRPAQRAAVGVIALTAMALTACPPQPPAHPIEAPAAFHADTTMGPGDVFAVRVFNEPDLSADYRVDSDGTIDYPLVGRVKVEGKRPAQISAEIAFKLRDGAFLRHPQVSIFVREYNSKTVQILGQVQKPGRYTYYDNMSVVEALSLAGGFTPLAWKDRTILTRTSDGKQATREIKLGEMVNGRERNIILKPGDRINVPERPF
ncbi:MAG TPA: polysaccharide biosynthesis/export family protein [Polyangia bacterium]